MKNSQKLIGAKMLSKKEQQTVKGGKMQCSADYTCPAGWTCVNGTCERYIID